MPRFFMNVRAGGKLLEDVEGSVLIDMDAARQEALTAVREMVADMIRAGKAIDGQCVEIIDQDGALRETVRFRDVIRLV